MTDIYTLHHLTLTAPGEHLFAVLSAAVPGLTRIKSREAIMAGLVPILWSTGTGSEVMRRIAAPMVGGMVTAPLLSMLVMPVAWYVLRRRRHPMTPMPEQPGLRA